MLRLGLGLGLMHQQKRRTKYTAETLAYIDALTAASLPTPAYIKHIDTMIREMKDAGVWDKCDGIYSFCCPDVGTISEAHAKAISLYNIKNPAHADIGHAVAVGVPVFDAAGLFWKAMATGAYIDTGYNPTTFTNNKFTLNDAHISTYCRATTVGGQKFVGFSPRANPYVAIRPQALASDCRAAINVDSDESMIKADMPSNTGLYAIDRNGATSEALYHKGIEQATSITPSTTLLNIGIVFLGLRIDAINRTGEAEQSFGTYGASLTAAEHLAMNTIIDKYLDAIGVAV